MKRLNKAILMAAISLVTIQFLAPAVIQTVDVLSNDMEIRRLIREKCDETIN